MSATHCPYDADFCQKKQLRFDAWQKAVAQSDRLGFRLNPDMFCDCPIEQSTERYETCERYHRYCNIVDKVMTGVNQSLSQMVKNKFISVDVKRLEQISGDTDCTVRAFADLAKFMLEKTR